MYEDRIAFDSRSKFQSKIENNLKIWKFHLSTKFTKHSNHFLEEYGSFWWFLCLCPIYFIIIIILAICFSLTFVRYLLSLSLLILIYSSNLPFFNFSFFNFTRKFKQEIFIPHKFFSINLFDFKKPKQNF